MTAIINDVLRGFFPPSSNWSIKMALPHQCKRWTSWIASPRGFIAMYQWQGREYYVIDFDSVKCVARRIEQ